MDKALDNFCRIFETYCKENLLGRPQIINLLKFAAKTLEENPLCICYDEIIQLKELIANTKSELKLKQKKAQIYLSAKGGNYHFTLNVSVPLDYPFSRPTWDDFTTNFPGILCRFLNGQAKEIVRKCIEPPLRGNPADFKVKPSIYRTLGFIIRAVHDFHVELCPVCALKCLPEDPKDVVADENDDMFVERAFCGHLYHAKCLKKYFREPPFVENGKICAATSKHARPDGVGRGTKEGTGCGQRLLHDKWALDPKKAEQRWAHKLARDRELEEVMDFFN